jgi:hypothetical protein
MNDLFITLTWFGATAIEMIELCNNEQHSVDVKPLLRGMTAEQ